MALAQRNLTACDNQTLGEPDNFGDIGKRTLSEADLQKFLQNYRHLNERVIGKAMSYAAPGDRFEILLQPRHSL